jgi:hypothetical protein
VVFLDHSSPRQTPFSLRFHRSINTRRICHQRVRSRPHWLPD